MRAYLLLYICTSTLLACNAYDTDLGPAPYLCGPTAPRCPMGYACMMDPGSGDEICISEDDTLTSEFDCADDSAFEPNSTVETATPTGLDTVTTYTETALAVCPARDRDNFKIVLSTINQGITLDVEFQANGAPLSAAILNAGGIPIENAKAVTADEPRKLRATTQNLPAGNYYAVVFGPTNTDLLSVNNYSMTVSVTVP